MRRWEVSCPPQAKEKYELLWLTSPPEAAVTYIFRLALCIQYLYCHEYAQRSTFLSTSKVESVTYIIISSYLKYAWYT